MRKTKQMKVIMILLGVVVLVSFLVGNQIIVEGLKNFQNPVNDYDKFSEMIKVSPSNTKQNEYSEVVKSGKPGYMEFNDPDRYNSVEISIL